MTMQIPGGVPTVVPQTGTTVQLPQQPNTPAIQIPSDNPNDSNNPADVITTPVTTDPSQTILNDTPVTD